MNVEVFAGLDPRENLAREAAFFDRGVEIALLWRNTPCVILGRNQSAAQEVSEAALREVPVLHRMSGGGAVYHDLNNVNFTFIRRESLPGTMRAHAAPILAFLRQQGLPAVFSGRNDILLNGQKVSGCAARHNSGCTLVHGTLLFRRDAEKMARYLTPDSGKLARHGVPSAAARTGELAPYLPDVPDVEHFVQLLQIFLKNLP